MSQASMDPLVGTLFDRRYLINLLVARGGMGNIYRAHDTKRGIVVAIKLLRSEYSNDEIMVQRFLREAKVVQSLKHENICQLYDIGLTDSGEHYFTMEFLEGQPLDQIIAQKQVLQPEMAIQYMLQVARGLSEAHAHGIVHRDLKPANIFIKQAIGIADSVKVLDFGVAKTPDGSLNTWNPKLTNAGSTVGTPYYMSPEQIRGNDSVDARSDVYSAGIILWECLFGKPPFVSQNLMGVFELAIHANLPKLSAQFKSFPIYKKLYKVLKKALKKNAKDRYQSMNEFANALESCLGNGQVDVNLLATRSLDAYQGNQDEGMLAKIQSAFGRMNDLVKLHPVISIMVCVLVCAAIVGSVVAVVVLAPIGVHQNQDEYKTYKFFVDTPCSVEIGNETIDVEPGSPTNIDLKDVPPFKIRFVPTDKTNKNIKEFNVEFSLHDVIGYAVNLSENADKNEPKKIYVDSKPRGAKIYIDGKFTGSVTPDEFDIEKNLEAITLDLHGYKTEKIIVDHQNAGIKIMSTLLEDKD